MKRTDILCNMLKCIFGNYTLSVRDGMIVKGMSLYKNCNYTVKSYNNFRFLFEIAFISPEPKYSDLTSFNRKQAVTNAKSYLSNRGITIPNTLPGDKQCKLIFDILDEFLKTIIIDAQGDCKKVAQNKDITSELQSTIKQIRSKLIFDYTLSNFTSSNELSIEIIDSKYEKSPDKCNFVATINCCNMTSYKILKLINDMFLIVPFENNPENGEWGDDFARLNRNILSGKYSNKTVNYNSFPIFHSFDDLEMITKMNWKTCINEYDMITDSTSSDLCDVINEYVDKIKQRAEHQVENRLKEELKPFYENSRKNLENLITAIISLKECKINFNVSIDSINEGLFYECLFSKFKEIFWDFEPLYMVIEKAYNNITKGLYIMIQNIVIELTDLLNKNGEDIASQFKYELDRTAFLKHEKLIKRNMSSNDLNSLIEFEKQWVNNHKNLFTEPKSVNEFFYCLRKNTFYNFQSALYKYYDWLKS